MSGEIFNAALLSFFPVFIGIAAGFLLLKIQGAEEE
ncbi:PetM family cytochrome b6-f complex subunit 7 [Microcoleus sp. FACHB-68]|nr:PetM family cytochrome b6-f complex subunit 7 [Microcoleus sp. FACHB-68]MBD1938714.1 cytochrome B6 [Microcoleus sp. FACHB-68]